MQILQKQDKINTFVHNVVLTMTTFLPKITTFSENILSQKLDFFVGNFMQLWFFDKNELL